MVYSVTGRGAQIQNARRDYAEIPVARRTKKKKHCNGNDPTWIENKKETSDSLELKLLWPISEAFTFRNTNECGFPYFEI